MIDFKKNGQTVIVKRLPEGSAYYASRCAIEGKKFTIVYPHKMAPMLVCVVPHPDQYDEGRQRRQRKQERVLAQQIEQAEKSPLYLLKDTVFELVIEK